MLKAISFLFLIFFSSAAQASWQSYSLTSGIDRAEMVLVEPDGSLILAGVVNQGPAADWGMIRILPNGERDLTFGKKGLVRLNGGGKEEVFGLDRLKDGRLVLGGHSIKGGKSSMALVFINANGTLDTATAKKGFKFYDNPPNAFIHYLVVDSQNRIVLAGYSGTAEDFHFLLARFDNQGLEDASFGEKGVVEIDVGTKDLLFGLAARRDGGLVAAGGVMVEGLGLECAVLSVDSKGRPDTSFGDKGMVTLGLGDKEDVCSSIILDSKGRLVVSGHTQQPNGNVDFFVARLLKNGERDPLFGTKGLISLDIQGGKDLAHGLWEEEGGTLMIAGESQNNSSHGDKNNARSMALARFNEKGNLDSSFNNKGIWILSEPAIVNAEGLSLKYDPRTHEFILAGEINKNFGIARIKQ